MKKTNILVVLLVAVIFFFASGTLVRANRDADSKEDDIQASEEIVEQEEIVEPIEVKPSPDWLPNLEDKLRELWGEVRIDNTGFVYYDLTNGDKISINEDKVFIAASTFKVGLNMVYYDMVRNGKISLDDTIKYKSSDYEGGTGILQGQIDTTLTKPVSIQKLLDYAIIYSDNIATNMLSKKIGGYAAVREKTNAMVGLKCETEKNRTTAEIQFRLLKKLYEERDDKYNAHLLQVMKETVFHDRMDKYLPYDIVAHKIGNYSTAVNDIGIVDGEHPYIFVMYTDNLLEASEVIAETSKVVYEAQLEKY